ncbi:cellulose 1,4-beta-cellobiosidase [Nonomuraea longispora]|uniref:Glucanase n=1 Tax=Nonomuraea longispora TaxID=1848320 RepID=A0A4R4MWL4_9ACTN|nr:glycoside hydrolase family 6 protein [Nonomuraea longispora]TDC00575.1 cellulose 1,4-beta-cellobiosidase [Nonomuraea longispora]
MTAVSVATLGLVVGQSTAASAAVACDVTYSANSWTSSPGQGGFTANITLKNTGDALSSWTLAFDYPTTGQKYTPSGWGAQWSQSGTRVTGTSMSHNGGLAAGASVSVGFNGTWTGSNPHPTSFSVNDTTCGGTTPANPTVTTSASAVAVNEGGTATFTTRLSSAPSSNVTVTTTRTSGDPDLTVGSGGSLTFTPSNWNTPQTVTLAAAQDSDTRAGTASFSVTGTGVTGTTVTATEVDDDGGPNPGQHVENPYAGATGYVNPDWSAKAAAEPGGSAVADVSTAVWMDRIAAIGGSADAMSLREHLDEAVSQDAANGSAPLTIQVVIYNLPNRDCAALASNGELRISEDGFNRYKNEYINPIADILDDPQYANLRIVTIIEPDSLPNLVTNIDAFEDCREANGPGGYRDGVRYALDQLHAISNVYTYVDAAHHAWLGWDSNFQPAVDLFHETVAGTQAGVDSVDGFIVNTANYSITTEPHFTVNTTVNGTSVRQSDWVDWNYYIDELTFARDLRDRLIAKGFGSGLGMLIDTSRNGWGGPDRPSGPSSSTDVNQFVEESRVDQRIHAGNWCNQSGAGMGERPTASPASGLDAYVWVKPPGESDGSSEEIDNDEGKRFDRMCDPTYTGNDLNGNNLTGALPDAPISGQWFSAQFRELLANAYPPIN